MHNTARLRHTSRRNRASQQRAAHKAGPERDEEAKRGAASLQESMQRLSPAGVLTLQRAYGNRRVTHFLRDQAGMADDTSSIQRTSLQRAEDPEDIFDPGLFEEEEEQPEDIFDPGLFEEGEAEKKEKKKDKFNDRYSKAQTGVSIATGTASTGRLVANTAMTASHTGSGSAPTVPAYLGGPLFGAMGLNSLVGTGSNVYNWYKAHKKRDSQETTSAEKEKAWKDEKTAAKGVGTGLVDTVGGGIGVVSQAGAAAAQAALSPAFGVGYGLSAVRNAWGGGRALHKAIRLGSTKKKLSRQKRGEADDDRRQNLEDLEGLAGYTRNRKWRTVGEKGMGTIGAGLGIAGLAMGATPLGWGLLASSAAVGLGASAWKGVKGLHKRRKRLLKIAKVREQLDDKKRSKAWVAKQLFFGGRMSKKREKTKKRYDEADTTKQSRVTSEQLERTQKTTKERKATQLVEKMLDPDPTISGPARDIGKKLNVLNSAGQVKQTKGWFKGIKGRKKLKFWKKTKGAIDIEDAVSEGDGKGKEHLAALLARKL